MKLFGCFGALFLGAVLVVFTAYPAVLQEAVEGQSNTYQTKYYWPEKISQPSFIQDVRTQTAVSEISVSKTSNVSLPSQEPLMAPIEGVHLKAVYQRASLDSVYGILSRYHSIPGGVTLEGIGSGLPRFKSISYDPNRNVFILDGKPALESFLGVDETRALAASLESDNLLGVSLGDQDIVYGKLKAGSLPVLYMKMADHYLGSIVFALDAWTRFAVLPRGFKPQKFSGPGGPYAAYFNFSQFQFSLDRDRIVPLGAQMTATLIPLTTQKDGLAGYNPDFEKIARQEFPSVYENNIQHVISEISFYEKDSRIQKVYRYGVMASFLRFLKSQGVDLNALISGSSTNTR